MRAIFWLAVITRGLEMILPLPSCSKADNSKFKRAPLEPTLARVRPMEPATELPIPADGRLTLRPLELAVSVPAETIEELSATVPDHAPFRPPGPPRHTAFRP